MRELKLTLPCTAAVVILLVDSQHRSAQLSLAWDPTLTLRLTNIMDLVAILIFSGFVIGFVIIAAEDFG